MNTPTALQKVLHFFVIKIIIGIAVVVGFVIFTEWAGRLLLGKTSMADEPKNIIIAIADATIALLSYILLFRIYENRRITELSASSFGKNAIIGFATGLLLQSIFIAVIYIAGGYSIPHLNPLSFLLPAFAAAFTAGFVAGVLILGVFFRLTEGYLGTKITLLITVLMFAFLHSGKGSTLLSVCCTALQAGLMLSSAYIFTRSLWLPIFLHFSWDFAEPGIFGGINPGIHVTQYLLPGNITGPVLLTGGRFGPQNSIQSFLFCLIASLLFLWLAKKKNNFIKPSRIK